jgi:Predicted metal-dependent hydrolase
MRKFIDLTRAIEDSMAVYPGDTGTKLYEEKNLSRDGYNAYRLETSMHVGTHIDAPMHLIKSEEFISEIPLENFIGNGCVIDVRGEHVIRLKVDYEEKIRNCDFIFLYTGYDEKFGTEDYFKHHPVVERDFAEFLVNKNIKVMGIDTPSPDKYPFKVHKTLFNNNIMIIENLMNLKELLDYEYFEIMALPLKIKAEASLVRVVAAVNADL